MKDLLHRLDTALACRDDAPAAPAPAQAPAEAEDPERWDGMA